MRKSPTPLILLIVLIAGALLAGCGGGRTAVEEEVIIEEQGVLEGVAGEVEAPPVGDEEASATGLGGDQAVTGTATGTGSATETGEQAAVADDPIAQRVVYFEYDSSILTVDGEGVVQAHAQYLSGVSNVQVILEGHADERGTREYNLALAEERAKAVADVMQALGIGASRIQTVSYGEERPVALGHDDSAWGLNRRVEILYQ